LALLANPSNITPRLPWVADVQAGEEAGFGGLHAACVAGVVVVVAGEVEGAVDEEVGEVGGDGFAGGAGFVEDGAEGEEDFGRGFVGEDVGGFVFAAVPKIQALDGAVVGEDHAGVALGHLHGSFYAGFEVWYMDAPEAVGNEEIAPEIGGAAGWAVVHDKEESASFLKKRSKKLLLNCGCVTGGANAPRKAKFFCFFLFTKRSPPRAAVFSFVL